MMSNINKRLMNVEIAQIFNYALDFIIYIQRFSEINRSVDIFFLGIKLVSISITHNYTRLCIYFA